jgi:hypothetical protein
MSFLLLIARWIDRQPLWYQLMVVLGWVLIFGLGFIPATDLAQTSVVGDVLTLLCSLCLIVGMLMAVVIYPAEKVDITPRITEEV